MSKITDLLGDKAAYYLDHTCKTIDKSLIHVPSSDTIDRIWIFPGNCRCFLFCTCCHCSAYRFADLSYHTEHPASACDRCHR